MVTQYVIYSLLYITAAAAAAAAAASSYSTSRLFWSGRRTALIEDTILGSFVESTVFVSALARILADSFPPSAEVTLASEEARCR